MTGKTTMYGVVLLKKFAAAAALILFGASTALADEIGLELNKLEARGKGCRAYILLSNRALDSFSDLKLDLVMFDPTGVVSRRIALQTAPLPAGKTILKVFDVGETGCDGLGRVLLNSVLSCRGSAGKRDDCLSLIQTKTRASVEFIK